jgi:uncharacterized membrane protein
MGDRVEHKKTRNSLIDIIRGLTIISMVIYHGMWNLVYIFGVEIKWYNSLVGVLWQSSIAWTFFIISGYCYRGSKHKVKNGIKVSVAGIIVTLVTTLVMPESRILFGVLTCQGACMLILAPCVKFLEKLNSRLGIILGIVFFISTYEIASGYLSILGMGYINLSKVLYRGKIATFLGFMEDGFWSSDYFGIIPWIFLYLVGFYVNKVVQDIIVARQDKKLILFEKINDIKNGMLDLVKCLGKHSLIIYMVHQPIVYGVMYVLYVCVCK